MSYVLTPGVCKRLLARLDRALDELPNKNLELTTVDLQVDVLGAGHVRSDVRQVDLRLGSGRKLDLGLLSSRMDMLDGHAVLGKVDVRRVGLVALMILIAGRRAY